MPERERSVSDRWLFLAIAEWAAIAGLAAIGVICVGLGVWEIVDPVHPEWPHWLTVTLALVFGVGGGTNLIALALMKLIRRIRLGPPERGRHTRAH